MKKQSLKKDSTVLINGRLSKIFKNKGIGKEWKLKNANLQTVAIIDELLKNKDSSLKYDKGITIIYPLSTINLVALSNGITRPSNHIGIIRDFVGTNVLLTYTVPKQKPFYGVIKSNKNIKAMEDLKALILQMLEKKSSY